MSRSKTLRTSFGSVVVVILLFGVAHAGVPRSLFVMDRDGSNVRHLVHVDGFQTMGSPRWSHDGSRIVFDAQNEAGDDNRFFIVNPDGTGLADGGPGGFGDFSPDDNQIAFAGEGNKTLDAGVWVQNTDGRGRLRLASGTRPRWSPDGSLVALFDNKLVLLDLTIGTTSEAKTIPAAYDWSPDGRQLAVVVERDDKSRDLVIVDVAEGATGQERVRLVAECSDVAWSPDGQTLAVSMRGKDTDERHICLLPVNGDAAPVEIAGQQGDNCQPAWSPDGTQLAWASSRDDIEWKRIAVPTGGTSLELVTNYDTGGTCYSLSIAPDGHTALLGANMGNRRVQVWNLESREVVHSFPMLGIFVAIAPNGKEAACSELFRKSITYFNLEDGSPIREFDVGDFVMFVNISADGSRLVCGSQNKMAVVFDVKTGEEAARLEHDGPVGTGSLSPDGRMVAIAVEDRVYVWDVEQKKKMLELKHPTTVWSVAFSPDGTRLATGTGGKPIGQVSEQRVPVSEDNSVRIWNAGSGELVQELKGHTHAIPALVYSPDGRLLASGSADGTIRVWDADSGKHLASASGKSWIMKLAFSYDGTLLLSSGGNFRESPNARRITDVPEERVRVFRLVEQAAAEHGPLTPASAEANQE